MNEVSIIKHAKLSPYGEDGQEIPVVINSGYRSEEVNRKCGGAKA